MYKASAWSNKISEVEVIRTTDKRVYLKDSKGKETWESIHNKYCSYFEERPQAIDWIVSQFRAKIKHHQYQVERHEKELAEFMMLVNAETI